MSTDNHDDSRTPAENQVRALIEQSVSPQILERLGTPIACGNAYFGDGSTDGKNALLDNILAHELSHGSIGPDGEYIPPRHIGITHSPLVGAFEDEHRRMEQMMALRGMLGEVKDGKSPLLVFGDFNFGESQLGKSGFARALAEVLRGDTVVVDATELVGEYRGSVEMYKLLGHPNGYVTFGDDHGLVNLLAGPDDKRADLLLDSLAGDDDEAKDGTR